MAGFAAFKSVLTCTLLAAAIGLSPQAQARGTMDGPAAAEAATVHVAELPRQGRETYERIRQGGPFPHGKDGAVFGNRERQLPVHQRG